MRLTPYLSACSKTVFHMSATLATPNRSTTRAARAVETDHWKSASHRLQQGHGKAFVPGGENKEIGAVQLLFRILDLSLPTDAIADVQGRSQRLQLLSLGAVAYYLQHPFRMLRCALGEGSEQHVETLHRLQPSNRDYAMAICCWLDPAVFVEMCAYRVRDHVNRFASDEAAGPLRDSRMQHHHCAGTFVKQVPKKFDRPAERTLRRVGVFLDNHGDTSPDACQQHP